MSSRKQRIDEELAKGEGYAPANVTDHPYQPPLGEPWGRCTVEGCRLAESVHQASAAPYQPEATTYRCPNCVTREVDSCEHKYYKGRVC